MKDIRWLYVLVALIIAFALLATVRQPMTPADSVKKVYNYIEGLPEGSVVLIAMDFDPQSKAELEPMAVALLHHCLRKNHRVVGMTLWPYGNTMANGIFRKVAGELPSKQEGRDYVYLGYQPGGSAPVIAGMGEDITRTFPQNYSDRPTSPMPIFRGARSLGDVDYLIDLAAGDSPFDWIKFAGDKFNIPIGAGCTAVVGPDLFVNLDAGQINGLIAGMRGAADYEVLIDRPGPGIGAMFAQSVIHVVIVAFVIVGNVLYLLARRRERRGS